MHLLQVKNIIHNIFPIMRLSKESIKCVHIKKFTCISPSQAQSRIISPRLRLPIQRLCAYNKLNIIPRRKTPARQVDLVQLSVTVDDYRFTLSNTVYS